MVKIYSITATNAVDGVAASCRACALGSEQSASSCVPCPPGHYIEKETNQCKECPADTYLSIHQVYGKEACIPCGPGSKSTQVRTWLSSYSLWGGGGRGGGVAIDAGKCSAILIPVFSSLTLIELWIYAVEMLVTSHKIWGKIFNKKFFKNTTIDILCISKIGGAVLWAGCRSAWGSNTRGVQHFKFEANQQASRSE